MLINNRLIHNTILSGCVKRNFNFSSEEVISFNMILVGILNLRFLVCICFIQISNSALNISYNYILTKLQLMKYLSTRNKN